MNNIVYFLSVAIPTNNKLYYLKSTINSLISQKEFNEIEVCISDNSGREDTKKYCEDLSKKFININYYTYHSQSGLDENINNVINLAKGKYVWLLGDDDLCEKKSLNNIILNLKKHTCPLLILNSSSFDKNGIIEKSRCFNTDRFYNYTENDVFLSDLGSYITFLSSIVVEKNLWIKFFQKKKIGTFFAHLHTILSIKIGNNCFYSSKIYVKMRVHSQTWTSRHFEIWKINLPKIIWGLKGYSKISKEDVIKKDLLNSFLVTLSSRAYNRYNLNIFKNVILNNSDIKFFFKIFHFIIAITPRILLKNIFLLLIHLKIKKNKSNFSSSLAKSLLS